MLSRAHKMEKVDGKWQVFCYILLYGPLKKHRNSYRAENNCDKFSDLPRNAITIALNGVPGTHLAITSGNK